MSREDLFQIVCVFIVTLFTLKWSLPSEGVVWCVCHDCDVMNPVSHDLWSVQGLSWPQRVSPEADYRIIIGSSNNAMFAVLIFICRQSPPPHPPRHYDDIRSPLIHDNMREEIWKYRGLNMNISHEIRDIIRTPLWLSPQVRRSVQLPICRYATHFLSLPGIIMGSLNHPPNKADFTL